MSTSNLFTKLTIRKTWADYEGSLFNKRKLLLRSKEVNPIFGEFNLMELKSNSEVQTNIFFSFIKILVNCS
jgi:hypothetical protein